jgi:glycosyltransferase involved in cell wall biosynthesis
MNSMNATLANGALKGVSFAECTVLPRCSILPLARAKLVAIAMAKDADKIVFIDDDMEWRVEDIQKLIDNTDYQITSLPYWCGENMLSYYVDGDMVPQPDQEWMHVQSNGLGITCIDRSAFEILKGHCKPIRDLAFTAYHGNKAASQLYEFFRYSIEDGEYCGEDILFNRLAGAYDVRHGMYCCGITTHWKEFPMRLDMQVDFGLKS